MSEQGAGGAAASERAALLQRLLAEQRRADCGGSGLTRHVDGSPPPLSFAQERLWFLDQLEPGTATYNVPLVLSLDGPLRTAVLQRSLEEVLRRHETLRCRFPSVQGQATVVIEPDASVALQVAAFDAGAASDAAAWARGTCEQLSRQPFDLAAGPLVRFTLLRLGAEQHWLVVLMHHIVTDGWSVGVFIRDLTSSYNALAAGQPAPLAPLPIQYGDYARWQRQRLSGELLDTQLAYWRTRLAGAPAALELPADRPRPALQTFRGAKRSLEIPRPLRDDLQRLSQQERVTPYMTLLAAFQVLLHRYSGQSDICVGSPVANRTNADVEGLIGFFVNTLVLRTDLAGDPSFRELLARVREAALGADAHQELPFERLVAELQPRRDLSRSPLFQVMFAFQNVPTASDELAGVSMKREFIDTGTSMFDLSLFVFPRQDGLWAWLEYNVDLFDAATADRMLDHYRTLLASIVAAPDTAISRLPMLQDAERSRLAIEWNDTAVDLPDAALMHTAFEAQVRRGPDAIAVRAGTSESTYRQLEARANRFARALRVRGAGRGRRVGLCVDRGIDLLAAVLGVLKSGAAYVPLDPTFPPDRLRFMAEDAGLETLVTTTEHAELFDLPRERLLLLDADAQIIAAQSDAPLERGEDDAQPGDPAYLIYTSGSTGRPKGVVVPHRAVVNFLASMAREPGLRIDDVLLAVTTLSFDIAVLELQLPLSIGATVVIASREETVDGPALMALLARHRVGVMQATPMTWRLLLEAGWTPAPGFRALIGGEALPRDLAGQLVAHGVELWNMYGPTETTVWSTCARIADPALGITVGRPIDNTTVYILDGAGQLCPIGVPGELYIGGAGVTLGYWNRPELTAERFVPDPFANASAARMYRTGDRARRLADGSIEHLGRLDDQVKIRGYRVELGEIEAALADHPEVLEAAVHLWTAGPDDVRIVACCIPARAGALAAVALRRQLRSRLPDYMIPQYFLPVADIPRTPNGKIDRRRLPVPVEAAAAVRADEVPTDPLERAIAAIWTQLIAPARAIGRNDRFFEMGGHSLLALRAARRMEAELGVKLDLRLFFVESLAEIASRCRQQGATLSAAAGPQAGGA